MRIFFVRILPYIAFLGTAVAVVVQGQQLNLVRAILIIALVLSIVDLKFFRIPLARLAPLGWFILASLPGTFLYFFRGEALVVPALQYLGIVVAWLVILNLFRYIRYSPEAIFNIYLNCATFAALVALMQQGAYLIGIKPLYDLRWLLIGAAELNYAGPFLRASSMFTEPGYFAVFLTPALYLSVLRLSRQSQQLRMGHSLLFISALIFSFSTIGYIGLGLCVFFALRFTLHNMLIGTVILAGLGYIGGTVPALNSRLSALPSALQLNFQGDMNISALNNGLNLAIALRMIEDRAIIGHGIGAYRIYSINYLKEVLSDNQVLIDRVSEIMEHLTLSDGGSMYLRLPSELGLGGMLLIVFFIYMHLRWPESPDRRNLALASVLFILVFSIRSGQLVRFELVFFLALLDLLCSKGRTSKRV
jgi:O-antigen ligase